MPSVDVLLLQLLGSTWLVMKTEGPLSEVARYVVAPDGIASTEWPSVSKTCQRLGWGFDRWQFRYNNALDNGDMTATGQIIEKPGSSRK